MAKVSIVKCPDYSFAHVYDAVKRALAFDGGMESVVKPGMKVLVKPNLLSARTPDEAVDTHPEVVKSVVRLAKEAGASTVLIGDSPGGYGSNIDEIFDKSGMRAVASAEGAELVKFTSSKTVEGIPFARHIFDCDRIISVPKLKTHGVTVLTAAIKNMYGTVVGLHKAECHAKAPKERDFVKILARVYSIVRPHLTVLDGIVAMEGDGPASGTPRRMNLIMTGKDAVAIDAVCAKVIGLEPLDILTTKEAHERELGEADIGRMELSGDDINDFIAEDFKLPKTTALKIMPRSLLTTLAGLVKFEPCIDFNTCRKCNLCKITCPVNAITISKEECFIDPKKCIKCLCCQEVCPYKAIYIKQNVLAKMIFK